jgi:chromosome segregation ATPase
MEAFIMSVHRPLSFAGALSLLVVAALLVPLPGAAQPAPQDKAAERNARRLQLQMQTLQQQVQEAQSAKAKADAEKTKLDAEKAAVEGRLAKQAQEIPRAQGALRKANEDLKAAAAAKAELVAQVAALEKQLEENKRLAEATLAAKDRYLAQALKVRDTELTDLQGRNDGNAKQVAECSDKNLRLVKLNAELLDRYRKKGVAEALAQRDPVLGFGDVQMFNLVQDYRDKADAERFSAAPVPANR